MVPKDLPRRIGSGRPCRFTDALDIAIDIDDYELISGNKGEYGRESLRRIGADDKLLEAIDGYTDFDQLGRDMMEEDGVRQTGFVWCAD